MNTLWNYMNNVWNYIFNRTEYVRIEPPSTPTSPRSLEFCYDCGNYFCVNTTKDIVNWKLVKKKTHNYYFCKDECWAISYSSGSSPHFGQEKEPPHG